MSFKNWLENYAGDQSIMDVATDAERNSPPGLWGPNELREHMRNNGAGSVAMEALEFAVTTWRRERQRVAQTSNTM